MSLSPSRRRSVPARRRQAPTRRRHQIRIEGLVALGHRHQKVDRPRRARPRTMLFGQLSPAIRRELVVARAPIVLGGLPGRRDPSLALEPLQGGIERTLVHFQHGVGPLANALGDAPAVHGLQTQGLEDEHVERALEHVTTLLDDAHPFPLDVRVELSYVAYSRQSRVPRLRGNPAGSTLGGSSAPSLDRRESADVGIPAVFAWMPLVKTSSCTHMRAPSRYRVCAEPIGASAAFTDAAFPRATR